MGKEDKCKSTRSNLVSIGIYEFRIIGVLPLALACLAESVTEIPLDLTPEDRGKELDINRLREIGGEPTTYKVTKLA